MSTGFITHPTLDHHHLVGVNPQEVEETERQLATLRELAQGGHRLQAAYQGPGLPDLGVKRSWRISYSHLRDYRRFLGALRSRPTAHTWAMWRHVELSWAGDGVRTEFFLPWRLAPHALASNLPPQGPPAAKLRPWVALHPLDDTGLDLLELDVDSYDTTTPATGQAVFDTDGRRFKLAAPPLAGEIVYASVVPLFEVIIAPAQEAKRLERIREPLSLRLEEV